MELSATAREKLGRGVKNLRSEGLIPAELYGHGIPNAHLSVTAKEFNKVFKEAGETTVVTLVTGKEKHPAIIHDIQHDPLTGEVRHVDFYQVKMDELITAKIPIEFVGEAPAVREKGAVLNKSMSEIEVEAFPQDLPHHFIVDVSVLDDLDKSIYVRDIAIPKGIKVLVDGDTAVASANPPAPEEIVEAPVTEIADVKVEAEEKVAAREEKKAAEEKRTSI